jgi:hypothetical protein
MNAVDSLNEAFPMAKAFPLPISFSSFGVKHLKSPAPPQIPRVSGFHKI